MPHCPASGRIRRRRRRRPPRCPARPPRRPDQPRGPRRLSLSRTRTSTPTSERVRGVIGHARARVADARASSMVCTCKLLCHSLLGSMPWQYMANNQLTAANKQQSQQPRTTNNRTPTTSRFTRCTLQMCCLLALRAPCLYPWLGDRSHWLRVGEANAC